MNKTQIADIDMKDLVKADWNYKTDGTEEQINKLMNSITADESVGVVAVRELPNNKFEVIDGNHRFEAIKRLGWKKVPCENFGNITKAKAITIARRRNHKWFDDDIIAYAELLNNEVLGEYTLDELEKIMPDTKEEMEKLQEMLDFDFDQFDGDFKYDESDNLKTINIKVPEDTYKIWLEWKDKVKEMTDYETDGKAFEYAIVEALNGAT